MPKIKAVICDFDGVINDSAQKGLERVVQVARVAGYEIPSNIDQALRQNWGMHGTKLIETCFGLNPTTSQALYKKWEEMDARLFFPLVKGAKDALAILKYIKHLRVGMLTSRNRENLMAVVKHYALTHLFDCIQAKDDWPLVKPDPRSFIYTFERLAVVPNECIYIGDTPSDFAAAHGAGVENLSVLTGIFSKADFLKIGQKKENIICSIADLPKWIEQYQDC